MYRQNQKEEQIFFVLIYKVSNKKQIYARQMAFQNSIISSFWFFLFCKRESSRRGIGKLRKRFEN